VSPPEFGEILARAARQTLGTIDRARREVELLSKLEIGQVSIGSGPWMADSIVAPALARLDTPRKAKSRPRKRR
jgi:DNA-binding transcriptional LysR family regulator